MAQKKVNLPEDNRENPLPPTPDILKRIYAVRASLAGTDRTDHLEEINLWEKKAKNALIFLALKGHEGIEMIRQKARDELEIIKEKIALRPSENLDSDAYLRRQKELFYQYDLWLWFLSLFTDADTTLNELEADLEVQESTPAEGEY